MLYDDYINYCKEYTKRYGEKTVVLMEVGSFFELYAVESDGVVHEGANMTEICTLLNIQSTRKNKSILECSRTNPLMAGFPSYTLTKFTDLLLASLYTIVLVEQVTPPPHPERKVTQVISPSTNISIATHASNTYLMCIYLNTVRDRSTQKLTICSCVSYTDISTGEVNILDDVVARDESEWVHELSRILVAVSPSELVIVNGEKQLDVSSLLTSVKGFSFPVHVRELPTMFQQTSYQQTILRKVYTTTGILSPIEYIQLEKRSDALIGFVYLLQFVYEHDEKLLHALQRPTLVASNERMRVASSSLHQLNIIGEGGSGGGTGGCSVTSLLQLLNTCETPMGKRFFRDALLSPLTDESAITKRYDKTSALLSDDQYLSIRILLQPIKDIERLFRRILLGIIHPSEMTTFMNSLEGVKMLSANSVVYSLVDIPDVKPFMELSKQWDMDAMSKGDVFFYKKGIYPAMDQLVEHISSIHYFFQEKIDEANKVAGELVFKLEKSTERQDYQITITKKRFDTYCLRAGKHQPFHAQPLSAGNKTVVKVTFPGMYEKQQELHDANHELEQYVMNAFKEDMEKMALLSITDIVSFVQQIDFHTTCAKNAALFQYTRPIIRSTSSTSSTSFIHATKLRHPLIEVIQKEVPYIANNLDIGDDMLGMLLYGINSVGKSSFMKSVGMNVVMAQAGMFVAAESFEYNCYHDIFTRIPGGDNLFQGKSTFVTEITELRHILQYATKKSLVIGDELAVGTESSSAISIVAAGILTLIKRGTCFLFATHLHEVSKLSSIKNLDHLSIFHLSVEYNEKTKCLMYTRLLLPGSGDNHYGLEVCKSLDMPADFLHTANQIRQEYLGISSSIVTPKISRYSSNVFVDVCSVCKKQAKEVHHIKQQKDANLKGFIGSMYKNEPHNLMSVCTECHDAIHAKQMIVKGYEMTSAGPQLMMEPGEKMVKEDTPKVPRMTLLELDKFRYKK